MMHYPILSPFRKLCDRLSKSITDSEGDRANTTVSWDAVFGANIATQVQSNSHPGVPLIMEKLITQLENIGMEREGIYRVPGRTSTIKNLIVYIDANPRNLTYLMDIEGTNDSRILTSLIKKYLISLPQKLLDIGSWQDILKDFSCIEITPYRLGHVLMSILTKFENLLVGTFALGDGVRSNEQTTSFMRLATLRYLLEHLQRVTKLSAINKMTVANISICFSPPLFGIETDGTAILEMLLEHWQWISHHLNLHKTCIPKTTFSDARRYALEFQRTKFYASFEE